MISADFVPYITNPLYYWFLKSFLSVNVIMPSAPDVKVSLSEIGSVWNVAVMPDYG